MIRNVLFLLAWVVLVSHPALAADKVRFGLIATQNTAALVALWQPLLDDLGRALGVPVEAVSYDDYSGIVWALSTGKVQLAWMGNKAAIQAVDRADAEVVVQALERDGQPGYASVLIARVDSPLNDAQEVLAQAGRLVFGLGDPLSTSGTLVPTFYLFTSSRLDPERIFKRVTHGNHESNFLAVAEGRVDVAAISTSNLRMLKEIHPDLAKTIKVIWRSPMLPSDPILWRRDLAAERKAAVRAFFAAYGWPTAGKSAGQVTAEQAELARLTWAGFHKSDNSQLLPVRRLELYVTKAAVQADPSLSADERARRLDEIDDKLGQLAGVSMPPQP